MINYKSAFSNHIGFDKVIYWGQHGKQFFKNDAHYRVC
jgi:hypothetical protein